VRVKEGAQGKAQAREMQGRPIEDHPDAKREAGLDLEAAIQTIGHEIASAFPRATRHPIRRLDERSFARMADDRALRAAIFRFVDVAPACRSKRDLAAHLADHLREVDRAPPLMRAAATIGGSPIFGAPVGAAAARAVGHVAHRFIAGTTPADALPHLRRLWQGGVASTLDLLGEATLTRAEAESYAARCANALRTLAEGSSRWGARPHLEADSQGSIPRANLSVKPTGLAPALRAEAPEVGAAKAAPRLRELLRCARDTGAHLHLDTESFDTRATTLELVFAVLAEEEFRSGPSTGVVLQAYLRDAEDELELIVDWARAHRRAAPLVVRLVKGAYWDYELALSRQRGWTPRVHTEKAACDRSFERLTRLLLEARPAIRVAIASHNLRSIAHAIAVNRALGAPEQDLELQVLRGLGDDLQEALARLRFRVRVYCPVGQLVEGMAYLVRRLLENTSNESFVHRQALGEPLEALLSPPPSDGAQPAPASPLSV
jgi:proline dehydrogenase